MVYAWGMASSPQHPSEGDENEKIVLERLKTADAEPKIDLDEGLKEIVRSRKQRETAQPS